MWGAAGEEKKYVISCCHSIQWVFITHPAIYPEIHMVPQDRKKYRHSSTFKELTVLLHDDKSPSHD